MKVLCPKCYQVMSSEQINISTDLAFCLGCNDGFKISESIDMDSVNMIDLRHPPKGAWFTKKMDKIIIGASTRSSAAFSLIPFMLVWSGFSLGGFYGTQIIKQEFDLGSTLFGIPFLFGSVVMGYQALMSIWGKVEIFIGKESFVFIGIGPFGRKHRFDWLSVQTISE